MGNVSVEGFQPRVGLADTVERSVEGAGKLRQFRGQRVGLQAPVQAWRGQGLGLVGQRQQRAQANARHPVAQH